MKKTNKARKYSSPLLREILDRIPPVDKEKVRIKMVIAARMDDYMQEAGMNNIDLARKMAKNPSEITKWLSGTHNFTVDTLIEISFELKVPLADLFKSNQELPKKKKDIMVQIIDDVTIKNPVTPWFNPLTMPTYSTTREPEVLYGKQKEFYA